MSFDFALLKQCSHYIVDEVATLDPATTMFFVPARTVASQNNLTVTIDGYDVPASGLYSRATVPAPKPGPYRVLPNVNDLLLIRIQNDQHPVMVALTPGKYLTPLDIAADIATKLSDADLVINRSARLTSESNGTHFNIVSTSPVKGKYFQLLDPRIYYNDPSVSLADTARCLNAYSTFGFTPGRVGIGSLIYPGWQLTLNPNYPIDQYIVRFNSPILNYSPTVRVSYHTLSNSCGRCLGSKMEYDYTVSGTSYESIRNTDLLLQEADKFLFTTIGSHFKWRWLGSTLIQRIGSKSNAAGSVASALVNVDLTNAFNTYQNIKRQQSTNFPYQNVSDSEFPSTLVSADSNSSPEDPTTVFANITIASASQDLIPVTRIVTTPDPFSITTNPGGLMQQASNGFMMRV